METLVSQKRVSFSNSGEHKYEASSKPRDRIPPPKTRSFKEGTGKKENKWFKGYFSSQLNDDYDSRDIEYATAVASAAFAVHSLEETELQYQKRMRNSLETSREKAKSRKEETVAFPSGITRRLSNKETNPGQSSMKKPMGQKNKEPGTRTPLPQPKSLVLTKAEVWERNKMEKIRKQYEKIKSSIVAWENQKKMHAKLHMEKKKAELERQKGLILQHYQANIMRIDQIAGGARTQMEEKRRKEENKARETARRIRLTGRFPITCFWFQCH